MVTPADLQDQQRDTTGSTDNAEEKTIEIQDVVVTNVELPSVDENSILNCSNTVDLLRTVMHRHNSVDSEALKKKSDYSDDFPIAPPKRKAQILDDRKGSSVSLPGDDVLAKSVPERSRLSKFKLSKKEKKEFDLSTVGTEEDERETIKSRIKGATEDDDNDSSSNSESEEGVLRRSSASSGTLEPYDTACSGDETKELAEDDDDTPNPFLTNSPPPTPENSPRRGSIDDMTDSPVVSQRSMSETVESITRNLPPSLAHISLSKSAILLTPRQWKPPSTVTSLDHHDENLPEVHATAEPSDHQMSTRNAMTSFIKGTYSDKLEVPERPDSAASSTAGSLGELEEDIYKLLSESKDKLDDEDDYPLPKAAPEKVPHEDQTPSTPGVPVFSSAELVRKQQELYIRSMRDMRNEDGKEQ